MLVALAVFSLAALALIRLQSVTLHTAADLDGKTLGQIVAHNLMMEIQTDPAPPSIGKDVGEIENGGRTWRWTREVRATEDARLLQVDMTVAGRDGASSAMLSFIRAAGWDGTASICMRFWSGWEAEERRVGKGGLR